MTRSVRMLAYTAVVVVAVGLAVVATWPADCGLTENCGIDKANPVLSGLLVLVACGAVISISELTVRRRRRRRTT